MQNLRQHCSGFTFIELVICLTLGLVLAGWAAPGLSDMVQRGRATTAINWLTASVMFSRHAAVTLGVTVTLCPSTNGIECKGKWHQGTIVFTDANQNRHMDPGDTLLRRFEFPIEGATIIWRAFQNRQYLQLTNDGFTNYQNGNFVYCPANGDNRFARQLVINMQGRPRHSTDRDGNGIVDDRRGRDLTCN